MAVATRQEARRRRHARVRKAVMGSPERPRLSVFRSSRHVSAQIIDDSSGRTLVSASTMEAEVRSSGLPTGSMAAAERVGALLAERAVAAGITSVVFDRGGYRYHGRVAALAGASRGGGLEF